MPTATLATAQQKQVGIQTYEQFDSEDLARKVYDMLMADIEPDLLSYNIDLLDEYYAGETEDERASRLGRYEWAYNKFDESFNAFMGEVQEEVRTNRRHALREQEEQARSAETSTLGQLEAAFT